MSLFVEENITLGFALHYVVGMYEIAKTYFLNTY